MATCDRCGVEIIFRYINEINRPMCPCGGWRYGDFRPVSLTRKPFTHERIVNCHARCKYCDETVIFYQSSYGGKVYFNHPLGPPWPKHELSCPNYPIPKTTLSTKSLYLNSELKPKSRGAGWKPFELSKEVEETKGGVTRIFGRIEGKGEELVLYILGTYPSLGIHTIYIKEIEKNSGKYKISTFDPDAKSSKFHIELDAYLWLLKKSSTKKRNAQHTGTTSTKELDDKRKKLSPLQRDAADALYLAGMPKDKAIKYASSNPDGVLPVIINKAKLLKAGKDIIDKLEILKVIFPDEKKGWSDAAWDNLQFVDSKTHAQSMAIRHILRVKNCKEPFGLDSKAALDYLDQVFKKQVDFDIEEFAKICGAIKKK